MPIDPGIIAGVALPAPQPQQNALTTLTQIESVKALKDQREALASERMQQAQALVQKAKDTAAVNAALQQANGDPSLAGDILVKGNNGTLAGPLYDAATARSQKMAAALEAHNKATAAQLDMASRIITSMGPDNYQQGITAAKSLLDQDDQKSFSAIAPDNPNPADIPGIIDRLTKFQVGAQALFTQHTKNVDEYLNGNKTRALASQMAITPPAERADMLKTMLAMEPDYSTRQALQAQFVPLLTATPDVLHQMSLTTAEQEKAAERKATEARTAANEADTRRQGNVRLGIEQQQANIAAAREAREAAAAGAGVTGSGPTGLPQAEPVGTRHPEALQSMPTGQAQIAKGIGDYTYPLPSGMALKTPYWQNLIEAATKYNPNLDISQYNVRLKARQDFTTGTAGKAINSLNTAIGHLDNLSRDSAALSNFGGFATPLNMLKNPIEKASGDTRQGAFTTDADAVATELTNVFRGSGGAEADVKAWRDNLDRDASQAQQQTNIQHAVGLLGSRLDALKQQYEKAVGEPMNFSLLNAKSAAILDRIAPGVIDTKQFSGGGGGNEAPKPRTLQFPGGLTVQVTKQPNGEWKSASGGIYDDSGKRIR